MSIYGSELSKASALGRFVQNLPARPYATDNPRQFGVVIRSREMAIRSAYIQPNPPWRVGVLPFDVDRMGGAFAAESVGLPPPTFSVVNPSTGHSQLLYQLNRPVNRGNPRIDWLLDAVSGGLASLLKADPNYGGGLVQNPLNPRWNTLAFDTAYDLSALAGEVPEALLKPRPKRRLHPLDASSRNCNLFDTARFEAYRAVRECRSQFELHARVLAICSGANTYMPPLPVSEVRSIARSITRWTWKHREWLRLSNRWKREGIMGFTAIETTDPVARALEIRRRRQLGIAFTNRRRAEIINRLKGILIQHQAEEPEQAADPLGGCFIPDGTVRTS